MLWRSRMLSPKRPDKLTRSLAVLDRWGATASAAYAVAAIRHPERFAIIDERGALTFGVTEERTNALARALRDAQVCEQSTVAVMWRKHRGSIGARSFAERRRVAKGNARTRKSPACRGSGRVASAWRPSVSPPADGTARS
jgi:hypothetical protein